MLSSSSIPFEIMSLVLSDFRSTYLSIKSYMKLLKNPSIFYFAILNSSSRHLKLDDINLIRLGIMVVRRYSALLIVSKILWLYFILMIESDELFSMAFFIELIQTYTHSLIPFISSWGLYSKMSYLRASISSSIRYWNNLGSGVPWVFW